MVKDALALAAASVRSANNSTALFVLRGVGEAGLVLAEVVAPAVLASRFGSVAGWSGAEVAILIGVARAGQGFAFLISRGVEPASFSQTVRLGRFDQVLLRPVSPLVWLMTSDVQLRYVLRGLTGLVVAIVAASIAKTAWTVSNMLLLLLALSSCVVLILAIHVLGAAITLFTTEGSEVTNLLADGGLGMASYPLDLYGSVLRFTFTFVIPVGLCVYVPVLTMLGRDGPGVLGPPILIALPFVLAAFTSFALLTWRLGLRHYRSTGS